ncbi:hypothetical protein SEA_FORZA_178 [Gordonia phage Forza]|uniref:Uncharacterized protein n=1 Tax=Gordonia phage Forza TaxID=2571247 RepID=A0A650EZ71_9CAUD|nr:hypothetical protein PP303_gp150 [Gordonia phage Forza]QEM41613.1 hypothetical protein SEA_BOOPY_177 [Gordonia phage Boopy]QGT55139.1 hypothetical protein SEA_FORZA_178 [Gordonia phage Forza]UXE04287.1 hypothetical protein SEA_BLUENGOLD_174 [Gordonia phage BlueNGold]WBF03928.1 hypothetical protein SEA_MAREELIH_175 [Gordonia phage Mareelih]
MSDPLLSDPTGPRAEVIAVNTPVKGACPECGERTLEVTPTHDLICSNRTCPDRFCLTKVLSFATPHHLVRLTPRDFTIEHPIRERKNHSLFECKLDQHLRSLVAPPGAPGLYHAIEVNGEWSWNKVG